MSETKIPKIAKYELAAKISDAPVGPLYRGRHVQLGVDVGLRVLSPALMKKFPELAEKFLADARAAGKVEHPCVTRVIDCGVDNQLYFRASQWPSGKLLSQELEQGSLPPVRALEIARDVAQGLAAGVKEGLLHGDVRPENILVEAGQTSRLLDIGLTQLTEAQIEVAVAGGVPRPAAHFRAPEVCVDAAKSEARSDMYSLGAVLFTMLAGLRPFEGASAFDLMRNIVDHDPVDLRREKPALPKIVVDFVLRLLAKKPEKRFNNYEELLEALEAALKKAEIPDAEELPATPSDAPAPPPRRKGATTKQAPSGGRKGTTRSTGGVTGTRRQGSGVGTGTGRSTAVRTGTGRQDPEDLPTGGSKTPYLIIGALVLLAVAGAVITVLMMDHGKPPPPPIAEHPADGDPIPPPDNGHGTEPPPPPVVDAATREFQAQLAQYEEQITQVGKAGDLALETKLQAFADANAKQLEVKKVLGWIDRLKNARLEAAYQAAVLLSGQERLGALNAFLQDFPNSQYRETVEKMRDDTAVEVQSAGWTKAYDGFDKALAKLAGEEIDKRRTMISDYLKQIAAETGNPYAAQAQKKLTDLEAEAAQRAQAAVDAADKDLIYNNFESALDKLTQYKLRFHDSVNAPKADAKTREIAQKAFAFWDLTRKAALVKLAKDVVSKSARQEVDNVIVKLHGVGTLADDARQFSENLKVFDQLQKRAATNEVIPNVQNRKMPECLYVQGKTGLGIREIDNIRIKMTEGGTPVTYMKNWTDLELKDRLVVYGYLLQPDGEEMPAEVQALLDKAAEVIQP